MARRRTVRYARRSARRRVKTRSATTRIRRAVSILRGGGGRRRARR